MNNPATALGGQFAKLGSKLGSTFKFQKGILTVAIALLILLLAAVGAFAYYSKYSQDYPPVQSQS